MKNFYLSLLMILLPMIASADESGTYNSLTWKYVSDTYTLTIEGTGDISTESYSNEYLNLPWRTYMNDIQKVLIGEGITSIGFQAFMDYPALASVSLPNSLTCIGEQAFAECTALSAINIPSNITEIGYEAFYGCSSLTSIFIPKKVTKIGEIAFCKCNGLNSIVVEEGNPVFDSRANCNAIILSEDNSLLTGCKNTVIPDGIKEIYSNAFYGCEGLHSIGIPYSVEAIGYKAFASSGLVSLVIPRSVTYIEGVITYNCKNLTTITVEAENEFYDSRDNCNAIVETESNTLISGCKRTLIPDGVKTIGAAAFLMCPDLTSIVIPNSVNNIKEEAFEKITELKRVVIGSGITSIGFCAFYKCTSLTDIYCYAIEVPSVEYEVFEKIGDATLHVPAECLEKYQQMASSNNLKLVAIADGDPTPSGIAFMKQDSEKIDATKYFSIDGKPYSQPQRGLNIIRKSDGSLRKTFMK